MKKIIAFILFPLSLFSQHRDSVYIKTPVYEVLYSEVLESPLKTIYSVKCTSGTVSRAGMDFYTNDSIHTSDNNDYTNNIYDKGHMAPAADFNCDKILLKQTFSYLNCALQNQYLNRGVWRLLELYERQLALTSPLTITIDVVFDKTSIKLPSGATVPAGFYKTINITKDGTILKYYFPNVTPSKSKYNDYLIK